MEAIWQSVLEWLAQERTQFVGSWIAVGLALFLALRLGLPQFAKASEKLKNASKIKVADERISRLETKLRHIKSYWSSFLHSLRLSLFALVPIVFCPLAVLVVLTVYSDWFFGTPSILIDGTAEPASISYAWQMGLFFLDQLSRGLMFDVMEVFDWRLSPITANSENTPYLSALVGFRVIVDIYVAGLVVLVGQALYGITMTSLNLLNPLELLPRKNAR